ncbi:lysine N(6)-hydroxylase/L-ornithine N(5)-oxygenase family protein [Cupriavidus pauculus]|uniref:lysine N(6)-hydroxylase/L-ornithine N(5)-oxygenase family protein n=1 Tax=Cupriavidus pauculus TaxID=82633 RepID=UPI001EE326FE|nr:lysine N(6)-hydroxylase/L-ornithine N(5)-oxygenase family protein [Cupriavidus pauculus]GJG95395.1 lysine N(6)-hydroxylase/L-ornithine N(5)-oxygenase family protein [Cupriavidus pauculus]
MTLRDISPAVHDLIGIGFGPSNLALAIALQEQAGAGRPLDAHFLEKQQHYQWHGNTLVSQSEMQISFLKDLVSMRNPTSPYSFVNYLHRHGRLVDFINLRTFYPSRMEYNDYLRWTASHFASQCSNGESVQRIEPDGKADGGRIDRVRVVSVDAQGRERVRVARSVVLSTGGTPRIPEAFAGVRDDARISHHSGYLNWILKQPCAEGKPMRIAVIGAGQSAAEAFIDLHDNYPSAKVDWLVRGAALKPADDSPFVNEIFAPAYTDVVFEQTQAGRDHLIDEYLNTNYSVIDADLIERIYAMLYRQKVSGQFRVNLLTCKAVQAAHGGAHGVELTIASTAPSTAATADCETRRYDAVVLATGYERESHRRLLAPLAGYLGDFSVDRNYRVQTAPELAVPVYLQGFCQSSHGLSDTLLSVLPTRAEEIAGAIHDALHPGRGWTAQPVQAGGSQAIAAA